jgi:NADH:ubiquinone oxidoreductase subunit 2 (subunit N)
MFPFFSWYINVLYRFPSFILFLARTFHKLPPLYIFFLVIDKEILLFILLVSIFTILIASVFMLSIYDLRYLLIVSSIGNNSFLLLAVITNRIFLFSIFYFIYFITIFLILLTFNNLTSHSYSYSLNFSLFSIYLMLLILNLASFPPFPGFFTKFFIFLVCYSIYSYYSYFLLIIIILNVLIIVSYIRVFFKYIVNIYSNSSNLILY